MIKEMQGVYYKGMVPIFSPGDKWLTITKNDTLCFMNMDTKKIYPFNKLRGWGNSKIWYGLKEGSFYSLDEKNDAFYIQKWLMPDNNGKINLDKEIPLDSKGKEFSLENSALHTLPGNRFLLITGYSGNYNLFIYDNTGSVLFDEKVKRDKYLLAEDNKHMILNYKIYDLTNNDFDKVGKVKNKDETYDEYMYAEYRKRYKQYTENPAFYYPYIYNITCEKLEKYNVEEDEYDSISLNTDDYKLYCSYYSPSYLHKDNKVAVFESAFVGNYILVFDLEQNKKIKVLRDQRYDDPKYAAKIKAKKNAQKAASERANKLKEIEEKRKEKQAEFEKAYKEYPDRFDFEETPCCVYMAYAGYYMLDSAYKYLYKLLESGRSETLSDIEDLSDELTLDHERWNELVNSDYPWDIWEAEQQLFYRSDRKAIYYKPHTKHPYKLGCDFAVIGFADSAFKYLDIAMHLPEDKPNIQYVKTNPELDSLRGDPRWEKLISGDYYDEYEKIIFQADEPFYRGSFDTCLMIFNKAKALDPNRTAAYSGIANILFRQKKYDEAMKICDQCLALDEKKDNCRFIKANIYHLRDKQDMALQELSTLLKYSPYNIGARQARYYIYFDREEWKKAREDVEVYLDFAEQDFTYYEIKGDYLSFIEEGRYSHARKAYEKALEFREDAMIYFKLGDNARRYHDYCRRTDLCIYNYIDSDQAFWEYQQFKKAKELGLTGVDDYIQNAWNKYKYDKDIEDEARRDREEEKRKEQEEQEQKEASEESEYSDSKTKTTCHYCGGYGYESCSRCNGRGRMYRYDGSSERCWRCNGTGKIQCSFCNGTGYR